MVRELKFRAWENKRWKVFLYGSLGSSFPFGWSAKDGASRIWIEDEDGKPDWTIEQYTGLKDKNGVEIYEGDVVRHDDGWTSAVRWDDFLTGFYPFHFDIDKELFLSSWEVIGNIYAREE